MKDANLILEFPKAVIYFNREEAIADTTDRMKVFVDGVYNFDSNCGEAEREARSIVDAFNEISTARNIGHTQTIYVVQHLTTRFTWNEATNKQRDDLHNANVAYLGKWGPRKDVALIHAGIGPFQKRPYELTAVASMIASMKRWHKDNRLAIADYLAPIEEAKVRQEVFNHIATTAFEKIFNAGKSIRLFALAPARWVMDYEHKLTFSVPDDFHTPENYKYERGLGVVFEFRNNDFNVWMAEHVRHLLAQNFDADIWHD
jgi:hypothetical protein